LSSLPRFRCPFSEKPRPAFGASAAIPTPARHQEPPSAAASPSAPDACVAASSSKDPGFDPDPDAVRGAAAAAIAAAASARGTPTPAESAT
jgi:hypothetical protein